MLIVNQMLKENKKLSKKERKLLEQHKNELLELILEKIMKNKLNNIMTLWISKKIKRDKHFKTYLSLLSSISSNSIVFPIAKHNIFSQDFI